MIRLSGIARRMNLLRKGVQRGHPFGALLVLLGTAAVAAPGQAAADTVGGATSHAAGCPSSGYICYYDSQNFNNFIDAVKPTRTNQHIQLPVSQRNRIESVRNRTPYKVRLIYACGSSTGWCSDEWMQPNSEDGTIAPLNAIDEFWTFS